MDVDEHVGSLQRDGALLATAAAAAGPDADIATCPGWRIRDLVCHVGGIHRWATGYVAEGRTERVDTKLSDVVGSFPDDRELVDWFRTGHKRLVETLENADPALQCWTFLPAPSPLAFWARRQAHETAIHRMDAQSALSNLTPFDPSFAADGIDELVFGFAARPRGDIATTTRRTMALRATDAGRTWLIGIAPHGIDSSAEAGDADCEIDAAASDLYLLLWNRRDDGDLAVTGDRDVLRLWRETIRIRWVD